MRRAIREANFAGASASCVVFLGDAEGHTLIAEGDAIALRTAGWFIDALEVSQAVDHGLASFDIPTLQSLSDLYRGEVLEGLVFARSPEFNLWLTTLRSRYSAIRVDLLKMLVERLPAESPQGLAALETWAEIAPFNNEAQTLLLMRLAERGRIDAGKRHLAAAEQLYRAERLDFTPVREAWRDPEQSARGDGRRCAGAERFAPRRWRRFLADRPSPVARGHAASRLAGRRRERRARPYPRCHHTPR